MGPITYCLCQKPVIGLVMYAATACSFPPLFYDEPFTLQRAGARVVKEFEAPVSKAYSLQLSFHFPSTDAIRNDEIVGSRHDRNCERDYAQIPEAQRAGLGRPIPIHVVVREKRTGKVTLEKTFDSLCQTSAAADRLRKTRTAARIDLAAGRYLVEIHNMASQSGLDGVATTVSLVPGGAK